MANIINKILSRNISRSQMAGFVVSNFIGLAIIIAGVQFYTDVKSIWENEDSFIRQDYLVINKRVNTTNVMGQSSSGFSDNDITELEKQPWVRKVGQFRATDYRVSARVSQGGRGLSTYMFFESIPDEFIDVESSAWKFRPETGEVPIILSKDYLTLYNFGFASSAGLPQLTEQMLGAVPLELTLSSEDGGQQEQMRGRVVGFSNRLNTILVPNDFMKWSNERLGMNNAASPEVSRLIIDVNSPGDTAIQSYLETHDMEPAGENRNSQATFFLNIISGAVVAVGVLITVMSLFILLLSVALLMQKNREKLHALIMLGFPLKTVSHPYEMLTVATSVVSLVAGVVAMFLIRAMYIKPLITLGGTSIGDVWLSISVGCVVTMVIIAFSVVSIQKKVRGAF